MQTEPAPFTELTTDQQTLIGDLEMVALHTGEYLAKLRADIRAAKGNANWRQAADRAARDAYETASDDLVNGKEEPIDVSNVDVSMNGIELQDREFFAAIREGREPNASVAQVLPCYQVLHQLEQQLATQA